MKKEGSKTEVSATVSAMTQDYLAKMRQATLEGKDITTYLDAEGVAALQSITNFAGSTPNPGEQMWGGKEQFEESLKKANLPSNANIVPSVTEIDATGRAVGYDIFSLLLKRRTILLEGQVNETMASIACASLLYLSQFKDEGGKLVAMEPGELNDQEIIMQINSPGGSVLAGLAIYDTMKSIPCPIKTVGFGYQASMGSILLVAGDTRAMTAKSKLMVHQIASGAQGKASDMKISERFTDVLYDDLIAIYVEHTGLNRDFWEAVLEKDTWLSPEDALEMGFIHQVVGALPSKQGKYAADAKKDIFNINAEKKQRVSKDIKDILIELNTISAKDGRVSSRAAMVVELSKRPEMWTDGKKSENAIKAPTNDNKKKKDGPKVA